MYKFILIVFIFQAYEVIDAAGPTGLSSLEFRRKLSLSKLDARSQLKYLERRNLVDPYMKDIGRQKTTYYVAKRFKNTSALKQNCPKLDPFHNKVSKINRKNRRQSIMTEKQISRKKAIIEFITAKKVVEDPFKIYRHVVDKEAEENEEYGRMDRKSFRRLLKKLAEEKELKLIVLNVE